MIAARLPGRTDNEIKNVWHTHLKKRHENQQLNVAHHHVQQDQYQSPLIFPDQTSEISDMNSDSNSPSCIVSEDSSMVQQYEGNLFDGQRSVMSGNMLSYNNGCLQAGNLNDLLDMFDTIDKQDQAAGSTSGYGSPSDNGEDQDTMQFWISVLMNTNEYLDI